LVMRLSFTPCRGGESVGGNSVLGQPTIQQATLI
jgi:hypothetical protein